MHANSSSWNHFPSNAQRLSPPPNPLRESFGEKNALCKALQPQWHCLTDFLCNGLCLSWNDQGGMNNSFFPGALGTLKVPCNSCKITLGEFRLLNCFVLYDGGHISFKNGLVPHNSSASSPFRRTCFIYFSKISSFLLFFPSSARSRLKG